jgi:hypothetical protein
MSSGAHAKRGPQRGDGDVVVEVERSAGAGIRSRRPTILCPADQFPVVMAAAQLNRVGLDVGGLAELLRARQPAAAARHVGERLEQDARRRRDDGGAELMPLTGRICVLPVGSDAGVVLDEPLFASLDAHCAPIASFPSRPATAAAGLRDAFSRTGGWACRRSAIPSTGRTAPADRRHAELGGTLERRMHALAQPWLLPAGYVWGFWGGTRFISSWATVSSGWPLRSARHKRSAPSMAARVVVAIGPAR